MSKVVEVEDLAQLERIIEDNETVVVDFAAPAWCRPCVQFAPHFDEASKQVTDAVFVAVDIDKAQWAKDVFGVMSVPTVHMYRYGTFSKILSARTVLALSKEIKS